MNKRHKKDSTFMTVVKLISAAAILLYGGVLAIIKGDSDNPSKATYEFDDLFYESIPWLIIIALAALAIIFIVYAVRIKTHPTSLDDYIKEKPIENDALVYNAFTPRNVRSKSFDPPETNPSPYFFPNNFTIEITNYIKENDPDFDSGEFLNWCKQSFISYWQAHTKSDIEPVRTYIKEELFNREQSLLQMNIKNHRNEIFQIGIVGDPYINRYERDSSYEYIIVYINCLYRHYVLDTSKNSNIPIEGDNTKEEKSLFQMVFMRRFGFNQKTKIKNGVQTITCPSCGADVTVLSAGKCEFCGNVIKSSEFSWVMSDIDKYIEHYTLVDNRGILLKGGQF